MKPNPSYTIAMNHLKILLIGPVQSGKSYIANFISEAVDQAAGLYRPTHGARILEYEIPIAIKGKKSKCAIELWDVSGDGKYEACWPAVLKGTNGVVFVYNQDQSSHEKELEDWYQKFVASLQLKPTQCCVVSNKKPNTSDRDIVQLPSMFDNVRSLRLNISDDGGDYFREEFNRFASQLSISLNESSEQEELNIMNS